MGKGQESTVVAQLVFETFRPRVRRSRKLDRLFPSAYNLPKLFYSKENLVDDREVLVDNGMFETPITPIEVDHVQTGPEKPKRENQRLNPDIDENDDGDVSPSEARRGSKNNLNTTDEDGSKWRRLWNNFLQRFRKSKSPKNKKPVKRLKGK